MKKTTYDKYRKGFLSMRIKSKELTKRFIATALCLIMPIACFPFSAFAAGSEGNIEDNLSDFFSATDKGKTPEQFNTAGDPYGESGYFNIAPQHELLKMFVGGERNTGTTNNDMYVTENIKLGTTELDDLHNAGELVQSIDGALNTWSYMQAVAFDAAGNGRDTHLAYIGYDASAKAIKLAVYDLVDQKASVNTRWVADATWIAEADGQTLMHFNAFNFMSITAGDYNGDGKDTLVVFASADGTATNLTEYYFSTENNRIYEQAKSNSLLHHDYINGGHGDSIKAYEKLGADLVTGDFDDDGIDDMAVISYRGTTGEENGHITEADMKLYAPYLGIAMGCGKGEHIVNKSSNNRESYVYKRYDLPEGFSITHPVSPALAAGDFDGDGEDELFIAGFEGGTWQYQGFFYSGGLSDDVFTYLYDISVTGNTTALNCIAQHELHIGVDSDREAGVNKWTLNLWSKFAYDMSPAMYPQLSVAGVKTNGANAPEDIFLNGTFYSYSKTENKLVMGYSDGYFNDFGGIYDPDDEDFEWELQFGYMTNVTVGAFDGNLVGREQVAYTVWLKDGSSDNVFGTKENADDYSAMLGISGGSRYDDVSSGGEVVNYGAVSAYSSSGLNDSNNGYDDKDDHEFFNTQMDYTDAKNLLFVAVDVDYDGVLAQYAGKDYTYSDPSVITVLQAAPYYKDFGYLDDCATSYEVTTSFIVGQSDSDTSSFSVGMNVEAQAFCLKTSISTGYTQGWESSFTEEFETSYSTTFTATRDNVVVMQRTPVILYKYLVQSSEGEWSEASDENGNFFTVAVPCEPVYALVSVDEYNDFVKEGSLYYNTMKNIGSNNMLLPITSDMLLDNEGDPSDYRDHWNGATNLSAATYEASSGTGHITSAYSSGSAATHEQKTTGGFYFDSTVSVGFDSPFGVSAWSGVEMSKEGTRTQGSYTTTANSTTVSGTVANLGESGLPAEMLKNYVFNWEFGCWQLNMGVNTVYVYGYRVLGARDGISLVKNLKVTDGDGDVESAVLTWDAVDGANGYTIYVYENGQYTQIATTSEAMYTYNIPTGTRQSEYVFAVTATMEGGNSIYSNHVTYYRQSYGLSAYEVALQNGFEGTVEEWLESLVGKDGKEGVGVAGFSYNNAGELLATLTDGTIINLGVIAGEDGSNGLTPYIDENGNWWIGEVDTGIKAVGEDGKDGADGADGKTPTFKVENGSLYVRYSETEEWTLLGNIQGDNGADGEEGANGSDGKDGVTPRLRINAEAKEWEVSYDDGVTWTSLGVKATGSDGKDGADGAKGDKGDTGASGADGKDGIDGKDGVDGKGGSNGLTIAAIAVGSTALVSNIALIAYALIKKKRLF